MAMKVRGGKMEPSTVIMQDNRFVDASSAQSKAQFKQMAAQASADLANMITVGQLLITTQEQQQLREARSTVDRISAAIQTRKAQR